MIKVVPNPTHQNFCTVFNDEKYLSIPHPAQKVASGIMAWQNKNMLIQDALPFLTDGEREFLITGILPQEWDMLMSDYDCGQDCSNCKCNDDDELPF